MKTSRIRPFKGQVLVELCRPPRQDPSGLFLPDPKKPKLEQGIVLKIGPWRTTSKGVPILPEFGIGAKVVIANESGTKIRGEPGQLLKLVKVEHVRAVLTESPAPG